MACRETELSGVRRSSNTSTCCLENSLVRIWICLYSCARIKKQGNEKWALWGGWHHRLTFWLLLFFSFSFFYITALSEDALQDQRLLFSGMNSRQCHSFHWSFALYELKSCCAAFKDDEFSYPPARQCFTAQLMCHFEANSSSAVQWQSWSPGDEFWNCVCFQMFTIKWRDRTVGGKVISPSSLLQFVSYSTHLCTCGGLLYLQGLDGFAENSNCSNVLSKYVHLSH